MSKRANRYQQMDKFMTYVLLTDLFFFILFLFASGFDAAWLKSATAIISIVISLLSLGFLYLKQELLRRRSLWMTLASAAIIICIVFSLVLRYPAPAPV